MNHASKTIRIGQTLLPNRLMKSAMSEQLGDSKHNPKPELARLYRTWAEGGTGLLVTGNIMISSDALAEPSNIVLDDSSNLAAFRYWTSATQHFSSQLWAQLNHPGKQSSKFLSKAPLAPSAIALQGSHKKGFNAPLEMTEAQIQKVIRQFAISAKLAKDVGFDGVQLHAAHGYLINQFLSPTHNQRVDHWGGAVANRMFFLLNVYHACREAVGDDFPISVKLNSSDFEPGGYNENDCLAVMKALETAGVDMIELSGGTYEVAAMMGEQTHSERNLCFSQFARQVKQEISIPIAVTGGFRSSQHIQETLAEGVDLIGLGRPLTVEPSFSKLVVNGDSVDMQTPTPTTGYQRIDQAIMVHLIWFEVQIHRLSKGLKPNLKLSAWSSAWHMLKMIGLNAFKPRRI
ncbi:NADH:flavin oxidoreductase/NADH oxidase family protein [Echinimonas agarilytica]|uniref:NADH:flavin oxidoreductase/NADH oxidase family protein n=1 Tax=Echinimonas agarilytica TaxID=1215918 RepID=A0AA41W3K4_9GAMM|nr:NADH:flavin oxidoreductase/NADH oxidase family protein [Echinimonas agarilytica]MCM2678151.1 NADH:flavin oxidoreductase/NADH oxidase family protein [Echinimonas agarilytica]